MDQDYDTNTKTLLDLFNIPRKVRAYRSEREELIEYFHDKLLPSWNEFQSKQAKPKKLTHSFISFRLPKELRLPDLYYLKSNCDQEERRGKSWSMVFWGSIKSRDNN